MKESSRRGKLSASKQLRKGREQQGEIINVWNSIHNGYENILTEEALIRFLDISRKRLEKLANKGE